jgi:hypothetical protein
MGWQISVQVNDVVITKECAQELFDASEKQHQTWYEVDEVMESDGTLYFNSDHMEHMDYVSNPEYLEILKKYKVNGDICFSSADGDNSGANWGYRFKDGEMVTLTGVVTYVEDAK